MNPRDIDSLIQKAQHGDHEAFAGLIDEYQNYVFRVSFRVLTNEEDANDIVQECFIRIWRNIKTYNSKIKFTTWIYKIAINLCIDQLRKKKYHFNMDCSEVHMINDQLDTQEEVSNRDLARIIQCLSQQLSPKQKIVFVLRDLEDLEMGEIVRITGMKLPVIKSNLYYARQQIRQQLQTRYKVNF